MKITVDFRFDVPDDTFVAFVNAHDWYVTAGDGKPWIEFMESCGGRRISPYVYEFDDKDFLIFRLRFA